MKIRAERSSLADTLTWVAGALARKPASPAMAGIKLTAQGETLGERVRVDGVAHPTVKPLELMQWLVRLVTPPGGTVLEPFAGSGTTVEACLLEGFQVVAIERETDYLPLIEARIKRAQLPAVARRPSKPAPRGDHPSFFDSEVS